MRLRQLQLDRDPDRRHRRPGAGASTGPGAIWLARGARWFDRDVHDRDHRRGADLVRELTAGPAERPFRSRSDRDLAMEFDRREADPVVVDLDRREISADGNGDRRRVGIVRIRDEFLEGLDERLIDARELPNDRGVDAA